MPKTKTLKKMKSPVSQSDWARAFGVSPAAVRAFVKDGRLPTNGKTGRSCLVDLAFTLDMVRAGDVAKVVKPGADTMEDLKRKKLQADIRLLGLQEETRIREIRQEAMDELMETLAVPFAQLRTRIESLPNATDVSAIIDEVVHAIQTGIQS